MKIEVQDAAVTKPVVLEIISLSGAHVEVLVFDGATALARHAFKFGEGPFVMPLPGLSTDTHRINVFVLALPNLNRMYSVLVSFNHELVAMTDGNVPAGEPSDSDSATLSLTVGAAP